MFTEISMCNYSDPLQTRQEILITLAVRTLVSLTLVQLHDSDAYMCTVYTSTASISDAYICTAYISTASAYISTAYVSTVALVHQCCQHWYGLP